MKKHLITALFGLTLATSAFATGSLKEGEGKLFDEQNFKVVQKTLKTGENLHRHDHQGFDVILSVRQGALNVKLNDTESHSLKAGSVLHFNGKDFIESEKVNEETAITVVLVKSNHHKHEKSHQHSDNKSSNHHKH